MIFKIRSNYKMDSDSEILVEDDFEEGDDYGRDQVVAKDRITPPKMTLPEIVVLISERIRQIDNGYLTTIEEVVEEEKLIKSFDIAIREFQLGRLPPYKIKRNLPNGTYELWSHDEFKMFPETEIINKELRKKFNQNEEFNLEN